MMKQCIMGILLFGIFVLPLYPPVAHAQQCPGADYGTVVGILAQNGNFPPSAATGCTALPPSGAATLCNFKTWSPVSVRNNFVARWPSATARINDTTGGCRFACATPPGGCRVGNDGLPVELLSFGVE